MPFLLSCSCLVLLTQPTLWSGPKAALAMVATLLCASPHEALVPCAILLALTAVIRIRARLGTTDTRASIVVLVLSVVALGSFICHSRALAESQLQYLLRAPAIDGAPLPGGVQPHRMGGALQKALWPLEDSLGSARASGRIHRWWDPFRDQRRPPCGLLDAGCGRRTHWGTAAPAPRRLDSQTQKHDPLIWSIRLSAGATVGATAFLVALLVIPTVSALRWSTVVGDFRHTISQHHGVIPATDIPQVRDLRTSGFGRTRR